MPLRPVVIELLISGQWTDITPDVFIGDGITIGRGQSSEGSRVDPGSCAMVLNNKSAKYSNRYPMSPYFGLIGRNTRTRVSVADGTPWLGLPDDLSPDVRISTPDAAILDIVGDLDVRFDIAAADWSSGGVVELGGKYGASGQRSWYLIMFQGFLQLVWSATGTATLGATSNAIITAQAGSRLCVRAVLDVNNGASGNSTFFYTAPSMSGPWTQLGSTVVQAGTTSIFNSTAALQIGDVSALGFANAACKLFSAEIRSGIAGTVVANPDCTTQPVGTTSWTDAAGRAWTASSALATTNRHVRFTGEIPEWPSKRDTSGKDIRVPVAGAGILRRLGKGTDPLSSTLRRRLPSLGPIAYWSCEDGDTATQAASPIAGVQPMKLTGAAFAAVDGPPGSGPLVTLTQPASFFAQVPPPSGTPASWHIEYVVQMDTVPVSLTTILRFVTTCSPWPVWTVQISSTQLLITGSTVDGTATTAIANVTIGSLAGPWSRHQITATQSGGNVAVHWAWTTIGGLAGSDDEVITSATVGHITSINTPLGATSSIGHLAVFEPAQPGAFTSADTGFSGDSATGRVVRLCGEQSVPVVLTSGASDSGVMGPQGQEAFLDLLGECADADVGILYEQREALGLAYRARVSLYNQVPVALDFAGGEIFPPFEPTDDDSTVSNNIVVSRVNGSSYPISQTTGPLSTALPPVGVGPYPPDAVDLNVATDAQLPDLASWLLHLGTWDEARYLAVTVSLDAAPGAVDRVAALDLGDRIQILNPPADLSMQPIDLIILGYSERLSETWQITFVCAPAGPWTIGVLDDLVLSRGDTDGSTLAAGATSTAATLSVATVAGMPLWIPDPDQVPFDLAISGERVTVTTVGTQLASNPFMTVDASGWAGLNATIARSTVQVPLVGGTASLLITPNGSSASGGANGSLTGVGTVTPGATYVASCWAYSPGGWSDLRACVDWYDASGVLLSPGLGSATAVSAGVWTMLQQTLTAPASASQAAPRARHGGTPAAGNTWHASSIRLVPTSSTSVSPQPMAVTRSVNGVVKALPSGAVVDLWQPMPLGL